VKTTFRAAVAATALIGATLLVTSPLARAHTVHAAKASGACTANQTQIWLGDGNGGGTAGTIYYPLEFSNISKHSCTLTGYPTVDGVSSSYHTIGAPSTKLSLGSHGAVTLSPGATAHAILGIHDAGAVCGKGVSAVGLKVYAPGQSQGTVISPFPFTTCKSGTMLVVEPIHAGVGVPGYTNN
jgi:hypothetical protein